MPDESGDVAKRAGLLLWQKLEERRSGKVFGKPGIIGMGIKIGWI